MSPEAERLVGLDLAPDGETLVARWGDGHESRYALRALRAACPCATCRAEREAAANPLRVVGAAPSSELTGVEPVGRYGLRPTWRDGHATGIFTFAYLRGLCPCAACRPEGEREDAGGAGRGTGDLPFG